MMVATRRAEEVVDMNLDVKPTTRALKRALLVALRCIDPESIKRPKMSQVVRMLEADEFPLHEVRKSVSCFRDCMIDYRPFSFVYISSVSLIIHG